jgi:hypothetical protein
VPDVVLAEGGEAGTAGEGIGDHGLCIGTARDQPVGAVA